MNQNGTMMTSVLNGWDGRVGLGFGARGRELVA
jgi:hypothetical protein